MAIAVITIIVVIRLEPVQQVVEGAFPMANAMGMSVSMHHDAEVEETSESRLKNSDELSES